MVDQLTAPHRVYDFIDLQQCLASMETALLAPEPCCVTSRFVLLDLREAHLYRCVFLIPKEEKGKSVVFVFGDMLRDIDGAVLPGGDAELCPQPSPPILIAPN